MDRRQGLHRIVIRQLCRGLIRGTSINSTADPSIKLGYTPVPDRRCLVIGITDVVCNHPISTRALSCSRFQAPLLPSRRCELDLCHVGHPPMKLSCTGSLTGPTALPRLAPDPTIPTRGNHLAPTVRSVLERPGRAPCGRPRRGQRRR